jgi:hypothetical protein
MYINAVADSVMLCLLQDFYNIIFKIKHKLYVTSGSAPTPPPPQGKIVGTHLPSMTELFWTTPVLMSLYACAKRLKCVKPHLHSDIWHDMSQSQTPIDHMTSSLHALFYILQRWASLSGARFWNASELDMVSDRPNRALLLVETCTNRSAPHYANFAHFF